MLLVIGTSYTAELALKGLYENTVGRLTAWISGGALTESRRGVAHDAVPVERQDRQTQHRRRRLLRQRRLHDL